MSGTTRPHAAAGLTDLAALARSFGVEGFGPVEDPNDLPNVLERAVAVIEKVRLGVTDPVAWAIAFMSSHASTPLSVLLGPTVTCQSSAGHCPDACERNA